VREVIEKVSPREQRRGPCDTKYRHPWPLLSYALTTSAMTQPEEISQRTLTCHASAGIVRA